MGMRLAVGNHQRRGKNEMSEHSRHGFNFAHAGSTGQPAFAGEMDLMYRRPASRGQN
jgi:hypothetical protein